MPHGPAHSAPGRSRTSSGPPPGGPPGAPGPARSRRETRHDDAWLIAALKAAVPSPAELPERARRAAEAAFRWRSLTLGAANLPGPGEPRAIRPEGRLRSLDDDPRRLAFVGAPLGIELEFLATRIVGQVIPPGEAEITVEAQDGTTIRVHADDLGFFVVPCRPTGPVRVCCERPDSRLVTHWLAG